MLIFIRLLELFMSKLSTYLFVFLLAGCGGGGSPSSNEPLPPAAGTVLNTQCDGTTQQVTVADGSGGQTTQNTENSESCGYVVPPSNEYFSLIQIIDAKNDGVKERCKARREAVEGSTLAEGEYGAVFEQLFTANINNDSYKDFFVIFTCFSTTKLGGDENVHDTPHVSIVMPYLSNNDGMYSAQAQAVFGVDYPELEAMSRRYTHADFNNDGREDYALAINWDDGRNNQAVPRQAVLMSQPNNKYKIDYITTSAPLMAHALSLANNASGGQDILWGAYSGGPDVHAWRYVDDTWIDVSDEYPREENPNFNNSDFGTEFVAIQKDGEQTNKIISHFQVNGTSDDGSCCKVERFGLNLWGRLPNGEWDVVNQIYDDVHDYILWYSWVNDNYTPSGITKIDGQEVWVSGVFSQQMCQFDDSNKELLLTIRDATVTKDGSDFDRDEEYNGDHPDLLSKKLFQIYDISNDEFVLLDYEFKNALLEESGNYIQCRDINSDGLTDIVHETFSGSWRTGFKNERTPQVYINRGNMLLDSVNYDPENVLMNDNQYWESLGNLFDLNGDGIEDLIKYSNYIDNPANSETSIRIYYGTKHIQ